MFTGYLRKDYTLAGNDTLSFHIEGSNEETGVTGTHENEENKQFFVTMLKTPLCSRSMHEAYRFGHFEIEDYRLDFHIK